MKNFRLWLAIATLASIILLTYDFRQSWIFYPCGIIVLFRFWFLCRDLELFGRYVTPLEPYTPIDCHTWARILPVYEEKKDRLIQGQPRSFLGIFGLDGIAKTPKPGDIARIDYDVYGYLNQNPHCYNMRMENEQGLIVWQGDFFGDEIEFLSSQEGDEHEARLSANRKTTSTRLA